VLWFKKIDSIHLCSQYTLGDYQRLKIESQKERIVNEKSCQDESYFDRFNKTKDQNNQKGKTSANFPPTGESNKPPCAHFHASTFRIREAPSGSGEKSGSSGHIDNNSADQANHLLKPSPFINFWKLPFHDESRSLVHVVLKGNADWKCWYELLIHDTRYTIKYLTFYAWLHTLVSYMNNTI